MTLIEQASQLAKKTPADRNRYVDFLRVGAIFMVVIGHWLVIDVSLEERMPEGRNALIQVDWAHILTWAFQVIPIFFLVGGYANAVSWRSHRQRGGDWASWIYRRSIRLLWPTGIFIATGALVTLVFATVSPSPTVFDQAAWAVAFILWFLAVYLGIAALTPAWIRLHDRWGLWFLAALVGLVAGFDALRFTGLLEELALVNYALVWGGFHQLGFAWKDGTIVRGRRPILLGLGSGLILLTLVSAGPYPVSMVAVPDVAVDNTGPPTLALLLLGLTQIGILLAMRHKATSYLGRHRPWATVVAGNLVIMSIYLWHVVPVVIVAGILAMVGVSLPGDIGSVEWFAFRPVWILMLALVLIPIVLVIARVERPPTKLEHLTIAWKHSGAALAFGFAGVAVTSAGLAGLALEGFWRAETESAAMWGVAGFLVGLGLIVASGVVSRRPKPKETS